MTLKPIPWKTSLLAGALAFSAASFTAARAPWVHSHVAISVVAGLALLSGLIYFRIWELRHFVLPRSRGAFRFVIHATTFLGGALLCGILIWELGYWRYHVVLNKLEASEYSYELPKNDLFDDSKGNGMVILDRLADDENLKQLFDGNSKVKGDKGINSELAKVRKRIMEKSAPNLTRLQKRRKDFAVVLHAVDEAQKAKIFSWNMNYDVPIFEIKIPRFAHYLKIGRSLVVESILSLQDGDAKEAERRLAQGLWLSAEVSKNPTVIAAMIAVAMDGMMVDSALPLIRIGGGRLLVGQLEKRDYRKKVENSLRTEFFQIPPGILELQRRDVLKAFLNPVTDDVLNFGMLGIPYAILTAAWSRWEAASGVLDALKLAECMRKEALLACSCLNDNIDRVVKQGWLFQSIAMPRFGDMHFKGVVGLSKQRMLESSYAVVQFKNRNGRWPKDLAELKIGEKAIDPVTNKVFVTRMGKTGFEICFFGKNMVEDAQKEPEDTLDKDIIFRL